MKGGLCLIEIEEKKNLVELGLTRLVSLKSIVGYLRIKHPITQRKRIESLETQIESLESQIDYTMEDFRNAEKLNNSLYQKNKRLKTRIELMLNSSKSVYFATFTLNDNFIELKKETLQKYLKRALKRYCPIYVANADYGKRNGRLHFHAVLICEDVQELKSEWSLYGFSDFELCKFDNDCSVKMAKYISKLTNHALKDSTKPLENKLIYSRDVDDAVIQLLFG